MKILSFGEILWDVYPDKKYIGGAPLNFSAHCAMHGEEVYIISCIGDDSLGAKALEKVKEWGIYTDYIGINENKETGKCIVTLDEKAVPSYNLLEDVAYDYIDCDNVDISFDVLYFGTLALRSKNNFDSLKKLISLKKHKNIFVDINIRAPFYSKDSLIFAVENATILKISVEELPILVKTLELDFNVYDLFARNLSNLYKQIDYIIITLGSDGAYALDCKNSREYSCSCSKVEVKSTVGAGDSFSAAFVHKLLKNEALPDCLEYASAIADFVVSEYDAVPQYSVKDFNK